MTRTSLNNFHCSLARTADIVGDKWTLLILRDAFFGTTTFSGFRRSLGIARNILTDRLDKLVRNQLLQKVQDKPGVERHSYQLTERGRALVPLLVAMTQWGDEWIFGAGAEPVTFIDRQQKKPIAPLRVQAQDGRCLAAQDITIAPGPAAGRQHIKPDDAKHKTGR